MSMRLTWPHLAPPDEWAPGSAARPGLLCPWTTAAMVRSVIVNVGVCVSACGRTWTWLGELRGGRAWEGEQYVCPRGSEVWKGPWTAWACTVPRDPSLHEVICRDIRTTFAFVWPWDSSTSKGWPKSIFGGQNKTNTFLNLGTYLPTVWKAGEETERTSFLLASQ